MGSVATLNTPKDAAPPLIVARREGGPIKALMNRLQRRPQPGPGAPPRFRSSNRDEKSDAARIEAIRLQVHKALESVDHERTGLERRLVEVNTRAASLLSNEDGTHFEREDADERLLVRTEAQMMNAKRRLASLQAQQTLLYRVLDMLG
jgi:hypothetical protein